MIRGAAFRGQPLLLLAGLLVAWTGMRVALWHWRMEEEIRAQRYLAATSPGPAIQADEQVGAVHSPNTGTSPVTEQGLAGWPELKVPVPPLPTLWSTETDVAAPVAGKPAVPTPQPAVRVAIGHNLLLAAGLAQMEVPAALMAYLQTGGPAGSGVPAAAPALAAAGAERATPSASRWSADGWLLLRDDSVTPFLSGRPSYGRSQAGAVIRYNLATASALRPQAYLRASSALAGAREQEVATGFSIRPLPGLPVRVAAEARLGETARGTRVRPAVYAVTELPPLELPFGARGEAYAQGGYVGGEYATAFVDGQARIDRPVARAGQAELRAGAGIWGGAQRDAARLDIGPTAAVTFRLGDARGRVAADYRFRVAGDAEPRSGPALTVSAGF